MQSNKKGTKKGKGREESTLQQQQVQSPPMTSPITLICLIHGQPFGNAFGVKISKESAVWELKEEILKKYPTAFPGISTPELILYKVDIEVKKDFDMVPDLPSTASRLIPVENIEDVFTDPETKLFIKPIPTHIHIIVVGPQRSKLPKRKLSVTDVWPQSTEVMIPAQKRPRQLAKHLYDCWEWWQVARKTNIEEGSITFPTNIHGSEKYGSTILVRNVYKHLYKKITCTSLVPDETGLVTTGSRKINCFIIAGTPGIGKSFFGFYLLCRYAKEHPDADIVWQNESAKIAYHRNGSITYTIPGEPSTSLDPSGKDDDTIEEVLSYSAGIYIVDGIKPAGGGIYPFVLLTSPKYARYKKLQKAPNVQTLGMSVWEFTELKRLWEIKFPSVNYRDWKARFEKWGGVPRSVLEQIDDFDQGLLEYNISTLNLDSCIRSVGSLAYDSKQASGTILHTTVTKEGGYRDFRILFASLYVENAVMSHYQQGIEQQLIEFLDQSQRSNVFESARGCIFEMIAHPMLARGGYFKAYRLEDPNMEAVQIKLPKTQLRTFKNIDEVQDGYYYRPSRKTFESIDALYISGGAEGDHDKMFQITVGKEHPIKVNRLNRILSKLRPSTSASTSTKIRLYFVVPRDIFPAFKQVQTYVTKKEKPHKCVPQRILDNVEQWALQLDYSTLGVS